MYCWETGGDAPQRIWLLSIDDDGNVVNRPAYEEQPDEWVTHEVFMGPDHILFTVMGHLDRLRETTNSGIYSMNIRTGEATLHGQLDGGGYWHAQGTEDLKWAVGDTFDGKLYRLNLEDPEDSVLLTTGHRPNSLGPFTQEAHSHHSISPDGRWVLFNSSMLTGSDLMMVPLQPEGRAVLKVEGVHKGVSSSHEWLPFVVRLYLYAGQESVRMVHSFVYDGDAEQDVIRGLGLRIAVPMNEQIQNRHIRFTGEGDGLWSEPIQPMVGRGGRNALEAISRLDPMRLAQPPTDEEENYPARLRIGPDWLALVGNWMTEWERTGDEKWRDMIFTGIESLAGFPYGLRTGRNLVVGMDPETGRLFQLSDEPGTYNLATIMGGGEVGIELSRITDHADWHRLWPQYARLYRAPREVLERDMESLSEGEDASFTRPDRLAAYGYMKTGNPAFAREALGRIVGRSGAGPLPLNRIEGPLVLNPVDEAPRVSTNEVAQWSLNAIEILEMCADQLPYDLPEADVPD